MKEGRTTWSKGFCFVMLCLPLLFLVIQMLQVDCGECVCKKVKAVS